MWQRAITLGGGKEYTYQTVNISANATKRYVITDGYISVYAGDNTWSYAHALIEDGVCTFYQNVSNYVSYNTTTHELQVSNGTNKVFVLGAFITDTIS